MSKEHKQFLLDELLRVDANVLARCNCAIAGGAVRDVQHGVPFKDVDVAFWNMSIPEFLETWRQYFARCPYPVKIDGCTQASAEGDDSRVQAVLQFTLIGTPLGDVEVDWLLYNQEYTTLQEVLDSHDHSISQYGMWYDEEFDHHVGYFGKAVGHCYRLRPDISDERVTRVKETCVKLDWGYNGS